jgi:phosphoribosylformylglycinamidine synthase II
VGDPFTEKLLIEACLEAVKTGAVVALQDMGAAGLTSSSSEMAARGKLGIEIDLDQVPLRDQNLTPYEMLLSESQERMLIVAERGREHELQAVFEKWDLHAVVIGQITGEDRWRVSWRGKVVADIPAAALTDEAPAYERSVAVPAAAPRPAAEVRERPAPRDALLRLLDSPNVGSKRWVYRQYDSIVQSNTVIEPGSDGAVLRIKGSCRALALAVDSNPRACALDPYLGAIATTLEAARNVACTGARPIGITDCLNYGNPERPEIMWQFVRGVEGIRDAALALDTPVVSGNVSFYNETQGRAIPPTPTLAMVGLLADVRNCRGQFFRHPGDAILLIRTAAPMLAASEYDALFGGGNGLGAIELKKERALIDALVTFADGGLISSAHDVSDGGLAVALAEACFNPSGAMGAEVEVSIAGLDPAANLFGEGPSSVIVSLAPQAVAQVERIAAGGGLECRRIGRVLTEPVLKIDSLIRAEVAELRSVYEQALPRRIQGHG